MTKIRAKPASTARPADVSPPPIGEDRFGLVGLILALIYATLLVLATGPMPLAIVSLSLTLAGVLLWISLVDLRRHVIPDLAVLALAFLGLIAVVLVMPAQLSTHLLGAGLIGATLWALSEAVFRWRGVDALGLGDVKLLTAATLWVGPWAMPSVLLLASLGGIGAGCLMRRRGVPFGPFIAISLWIVWLFGPMI